VPGAADLDCHADESMWSSTVHGPGDTLPTAAARFVNKSALVTATRTLSFAEVPARGDRVAAWLAAAGPAGERGRARLVVRGEP
jgi:non-ribosomal peptide synthetase component E (peptide arylation enzyme)